MKRNTLFALLSVIGIFLLPQASHAQGLGNYGFATGVDSTKWVDISSARDMLGCSDDDALASELKVIGFSFPFGSSSYTSYSVNTDGNLRLGSNVTGTGYSTPPFSSLNADYNSPKINAFGCDGYGTSLHYVKSSTILTPSNELMLVVEFCLGTNSIISRYNLYKWQVHLFPNGNIDIVFPPADQLPAAPPDVSHQCGICTNSFDGWVISSSHNTAQHFTYGSLATNNPYTWFDANRYYSFIHYNNFTCPAPTGVTASNITTDSATISWTAGGNEILWQLEVGGNVYYTTTTTFSVGNLDANTDYTASVRAICAASDTSLAAPCYFHTDCSPLSILPYSNGFENYPYYPATNLVEALPFCWHRYNDASGSSTYYPYVVSNDNYAHSGQNGLYWHHVSTSSSARNQYAILPPVDLNQYDISDLTLAFYAKTDFIGNLALPVVGVMDSPTDTASFTPVHFLSDTEVGNEWQLVTVPLSNYAGTGSYIAIKWHNPGSACSFAIDDIMLTDSWCNPPMNVTASVSSDSLTVSWERNGGSSFSVVLGNDTVNAVTDTFYTFSNLAGNTLYSYAVATECTSSHGMYVAGNIRTLCSALDVLPFAEGFESVSATASSSVSENNLPFCWSYHNDGAIDYSAYPLVIIGNEAHGGSRSLMFYSHYNADLFSDQYAVMPATDSTLFPINHLKLSFWMRTISRVYNSYCVVGVMRDPTDTSSFVAVDTVYSNRSTSYVRNTVPLSSYNGPHGRVAFKFPRPNGGYNHGYVDDILLEDMPPCPYVSSHNVVASPSAATMSWTYEHGYQEGPESYEVSYSYAADSLHGATSVTVSSPSLTLTGLDPDTSYMVSIRYVCDNPSNPPYIFFFSTRAAPDSCMAPTLFVEENENGNIVASWLPGYRETSWDLDCRAVDSSAWSSILVGTTSNSFTFSSEDLRPNTLYYFRVTANCGDNVRSTIAQYTTPCLPLVLPYTYGFEDFSTPVTPARYIPCWHTHFSNGVYVSTSSARTGNRGLVWEGNNGDRVIIMPRLNSTENPINTVRLSFWANTVSYRGNIPLFRVGVLSDPDDFYTFQLVDTVILNTSSGWTYYEVLFDGFSGNGEYITIVSGNTNTFRTDVYFDDIRIDVIPDCHPITGVSASNITPNSAEISWDATSADLYQIQYGHSGFSPGNGTSVSSQLPSVILQNLTDNTIYDVYVRGICGMDTTGWSFLYSFRSGCTAIYALPFFEGFEGYPSGAGAYGTDFIPCWTRLIVEDTNNVHFGYSLEVYTMSENHTVGGRNVAFWSNSSYCDSSHVDIYMILPQVDTSLFPINTLRLSLWCRSAFSYELSHTDSILVGVMDDNTDTAFHVVGSYSIGMGQGWTEFVCDFDNYHGNGSYIAIRVINTDSNYCMTYIYFDDITLDRIPPCPRVENLSAFNISSDGATVFWSDNSGNSGWNIEFDTVEFAPGTNVVSPIHVTDTFYTLANLDTGTLYHVYVYPDCPGGVIYRHVAFRTIASSPATVPYSCFFEDDGNNGWTFIDYNQHNHWIVGNATNNGGNSSLYITDDSSQNNYSQFVSHSYAFRQFDLQPGDYLLSYDWKALGEYGKDYLRVALVPDDVDLFVCGNCGFDTANGLPYAAIPLDGGSQLVHSDSYYHGEHFYYLWNTREEPFSITSPGIYKLVFYWTNDDYAYWQPPAAIDNVYLINNNCPKVTDININVTSSTADISWSPGGNEGSWLVTVGSSSAVVQNNTFHAYLLQPNTDYPVTIRAICSDGDTSLPVFSSFHTLCSYASLPYFDDFEGYTTDGGSADLVPPCWVSNGHVTRNDFYASSGEYVFIFHEGGYIELPLMPVSLNSLKISFWDYSQYTENILQVGVMEGNNFVPIQTFNNTGTLIYREVDLSSYTGTSRVIAIHNPNSSDMFEPNTHYIDDILVELQATCPSVVNVTSAGSTSTSIDLDWTDRVGVLQWEIEYGPIGYTFGSPDATRLFSTSHPVTISGLDTLTEYDFYVRPICSDTDTGEWSAPATLPSGICDSGVDIFTGTPLWPSSSVPINTSDRYSLSETIIDSAELAGSVDIEAIAFRALSSSQLTGHTNVSIWLQPTDKQTFSSREDFVALDTTIAVRVYHGNLNCSQGWNYFWFDNIYTWDGHSNLLVIVDDNSNQYYNGNSPFQFCLSACNGNKSLHYHSYNYNPNPLYPTSFSSSISLLSEQRPTMRLVSCGSACFRPSTLATTGITYDHATLNWSSSASAFEVAVKQLNSPSWPPSDTVYWDPSVPNYQFASVSHEISGLQPVTAYLYRVRAICDSAGSHSDWAERTFLSGNPPCATPSNLVTTDIGYSDASFAWTADPSQNQWIVRIWSAAGYIVQTLSQTGSPSITVSRLFPGTTYRAAVKGDCGSDYSDGDFCQPVTFTTLDCNQASDVSVSDITDHEALVSWNALQTVKYEIEYGDHNFSHGYGTTVVIDDGMPLPTSFTLTGLEAAHDYSLYLRAFCDPYAAGPWSTRVDFTTLGEGGVGIPEIASPAPGLSIYPNPAHHDLSLAFTGVSGDVVISIIDHNGRTVANYEFGNPTSGIQNPEPTSGIQNSEPTPGIQNSEFKIDISSLPQGLYFIRANAGNLNLVKKFVVK